MGVGIGFSSSHRDVEYINVPNPLQPDPANWELLRHHELPDVGLLMLVRYPNCTNYEGMKILLFRKTTVADILRQKTLDPHFLEDPGYHSPIARFAPTHEGWWMGVDALLNMSELRIRVIKKGKWWE